MISQKGKEMLAFQEQLVGDYKYKPIGINFFVGDVRQKFADALPEWCKQSKIRDVPLCSLDGTMVAKGYVRIVIGDYGAFVEIAPEQMCHDNIHCKPGQEYRMIDERYRKNAKYFWLTPKDMSDCKIYHQQKCVSYADYIPGMYYISPYEIEPKNQEETM